MEVGERSEPAVKFIRSMDESSLGLIILYPIDRFVLPYSREPGLGVQPQDRATGVTYRSFNKVPPPRAQRGRSREGPY